MPNPAFQPGFRLSFADVVILLAGIGGTIVLAKQGSPLALVIGVVVGHFFLFCNIFRIPRVPELIWAVAFLALAAATLVCGLPGWPVTLSASVILSSFLIWRATRLPGYHGVCWQRWNPGLPQWWQDRQQSQR